MSRTVIAGLAFAALSLAGLAAPAVAGEAPRGGKADTQFLGVDLDNGRVFYNGRNSGVYCLYRTARVFNTWTGYYEWRRIRRCGRGLYL